jgi:glyoxylase I family protein
MPTFSHLALSVADLPRMSRFYSEALGFESGETYRGEGRSVRGLMEIEGDGFDGVFMRRGDFFLELLAYGKDAASGGPVRAADALGFAHISFLVEDLPATVARIKECGGEERGSFRLSFSRGDLETEIAFLLDPEGNRVELVAHDGGAEAAAHGAFLGLANQGWPPCTPGS